MVSGDVHVLQVQEEGVVNECLVVAASVGPTESERSRVMEPGPLDIHAAPITGHVPALFTGRATPMRVFRVSAHYSSARELGQQRDSRAERDLW